MKKIIISLMLMCALFAANAGETLLGLKVGDGSAKKVLAVYIEVEPAKVDDFLKIMVELVKKTQTEDGCLEYTLYRYGAGNLFFLYEEYVTVEAFNKHKDSDHFKAFVKARDALGGVVMRSKNYDIASVKSSMQQKKK